MFTPSGRFKTNTQLCMSMTNYHPESWNPMWSVGTILNGLLSFMQESAVSTGSISASREMRQQLAQESLQWNSTNLTFKKLFPDYMELAAARSKQEASASGQAPASTAQPSSSAPAKSSQQGGTDPGLAQTQVASAHQPGEACMSLTCMPAYMFALRIMQASFGWSLPKVLHIWQNTAISLLVGNPSIAEHASAVRYPKRL